MADATRLSDHDTTQLPAGIPAHRAIAVVLVQLFCAVVATGVGARDAAIVTVAAIPLIGGGAAIFAFLTRTNQLSFAALIGGGIAIGTMVPALTSFVIGELGYRGLIDDYVFLIAFGLAAWRAFVGHRPRVAVDSAPPTLLALTFGVAVFGYYGWGPFIWPFLIGAVSTLLIGLSVIRLADNQTSLQQNGRAWTLVLFAVPVIGLITQAIVDGKLQLPRSFLFAGGYTDNQFDEALAFSVARWGYDENPFFVGHEVSGYLLSNLWAGNLTDVLKTPPLMVLSSFGPLIALIAILYLTYLLATSIFYKHSTGMAAIILAGLQGSLHEIFPFTEPPRIQHFLTTTWVLLGFVLLELHLSSRVRVPVFSIAVVITALSLGKPQISVFYAMFIGITSTIAIVIKSLRKLILSLLCLSAIWILSYVIFSSTTFSAPNQYIGSQRRNWIAFANIDTAFNWLIPILLIFILRIFVILTLFNPVKDATTSIFLLRVQIVCLVTAIAYALFHDANALRHTVTVALVLGGIAASQLVVDAMKYIKTLAVIILLAVGFALGAAAFAFSERSVILSATTQDGIVSFVFEYQLHLLTLAILTITLLSAVFPTTFINETSSQICQRKTRYLIGLSAFVTMAVGSNIGVLSSWTSRHFIRNVIYESNGLSKKDLGSQIDPMVSVATWIRENSAINTIVAHNALCKPERFDILLPTLEPNSDCVLRNTSSWVSAMSHRRTYLDRPLNALIENDRLETANLRYRNSVLFATEALPAAMEDFERVGVDYFVVDLSQTELRSWEPYGTIVYRDENYLVLRLNY